MKTAIIHDWLVAQAGAEKVLSAIHSLYPSPVYTLVQKEETARAVLQNAKARPSFLQRLPFAARLYRNFLPLYPLAAESFDLSAYDLIISSSHAAAKGVRTRPGQLHLCYCHTPMRYAWDMRGQYMDGLDCLRRAAAVPVLAYMRRWDRANTARVDRFIANSHHVARRIRRAYGREAAVIHPPVDVESFPLTPRKARHFVTVSRLVPYKRVDLIVQAFTRLGLPLIVIGDGPERARVRAGAGRTVEFLGAAPFSELRRAVSTARAFVFMAEEDFGIAPVEALACGTPVIAYRRGGVGETVRDGIDGVLFDSQTPQALAEALDRFASAEGGFDGAELRRQAEQFSKERFLCQFQQFVRTAWDEFTANGRRRGPISIRPLVTTTS